MRRITVLFLSAVVGLAAAPALAQPDTRGTCDVAVWTDAAYSADRMGLLNGGALDAMLKKADVPEINSTAAIKHMLPPTRLFDLVAKSNLSAILDREVNYVHSKSFGEAVKADRKRLVRSTDSSNPCYIEIYVNMIYYQSAPFHGERIFSYYHFKDFRGPKLVKSNGYDNGQMKNFSDQTVEVATGMAGDAVSVVFNKLAAKRFGAGRAAGR